MTSWVPFDLLDHLWQSTLFAAAVWLVARMLRANGARLRYWLWFAASMKFLIPLSLLVSACERLAWRTEPLVAPLVVSFVIDQVLTPAGTAQSSTIVETVALGAPLASPAPVMSWLLLATWAAGVAFVLVSWWTQWLPFRRARAEARAIDIRTGYNATGLTILGSPSMIEPGVVGIRNPVLLVPDGISDRLSSAQLRALIAHEHCHVRYRDNLTAAVHMAVEAVFWFYPVVWWIERRLIDERERACDEYVLQCGSTPHDYAAGILEVCRFATERSPVFVAGVTGSDLKRRIRSILGQQIGRPLGGLRAGALCMWCAAAALGPVVLGAVNTPAQEPAGTAAAAFEVAGMRKNPPDVETSTSNARPAVYQLQNDRVAPRVAGAPLQSPEPQPHVSERPRFEVASIRQNTSASGSNNLNIKGETFTIANFSLMRLMQFAYSVTEAQIIGGPEWVRSHRFDINAKFAAGSTRDQLTLMLRALVEERFQLRLRNETREMPLFELTLARDDRRVGPNLHDCSNTDDKAGLSTPEKPFTAPRGGAVAAGACAPMSNVASLAAGRVQAIVQDKTGLPGNWRYDIYFGPDLPDPNSANPDLPSFVTALGEQLGLKLERTRGPVDVLVIESAEQPAEN
jgi:bla regulator protein BlaR1